jgi:TonB family protein
MPMFVEKRRRRVISTSTPASPEQKQRRQMQLALALLVVALIGVIVRDRQFWFPAPPVAEPEFTEQDSPATPAVPQPQTQAAKSTDPHRVAAKSHPVTLAADRQPVVAPVVLNRAVLPPLEVEVVAGDQRRVLPPSNNAVKIEMQPLGASSSTNQIRAEDTNHIVMSAAEHVRLSPDTQQVVSRSVEPSYPMLARQMKVQGSVVLQALIRADGNIQDLRVLSGPAILSAAAREAVKQWRFKPYLQEGHPVETEARITVNFTISTY